MLNKRTWLTQFLLILEVTNPAYENLSLDIDEKSVLVLHNGLAPHGPQAIVQKPWSILAHRLLVSLWKDSWWGDLIQV